MLKNMSLGTYYVGTSLLHRLQARTKLLSIFWIVIWLFIARERSWHFVPYIALVVLLALTIACSGISPLELWRRMWLLILLTVIGLYSVLSAVDSSSPTLLSYGPWYTSYSLLRELLLSLGCITLFFWLTALLPIGALRTWWKRRWPRRLRSLLFLAALASWFFFWLILDEAGTQRFAIGPLVITQDSVWTLLSSSSMLLVLFAFSLLLTMTSSPVALIEALNMLLAPLRRLKLPVDSFSLMTLLALRFFPTLMDEAEQLMKAQSARGGDILSGTLRERLQSLPMLLVPLIRSVLRLAAELATALEARGYQSDGRQTRLYETGMHWQDYAVLLFVLLLTIPSLIF